MGRKKEDIEYKQDLINEIKKNIFKNQLFIFTKNMDSELEKIIVRNENEKYSYKLLKHVYSQKKTFIFSEIFQKNIENEEEKFQVVIKYLKKYIEHYFILEKNRSENKEKNKMIRSDDKNKDEYYLFNDCCKIITEEILDYEKCSNNVPKYLALRIKGFHTGDFIQNYSSKKSNKKPCYSYEVIKATILINKNKIIKALNNKNFNDEKSKINYICAIIERNLNDTKLRFEKIEKAKQKTEIEMDKNVSSFEKEYICMWEKPTDNYIRKSKDKKNIDEFW